MLGGCGLGGVSDNIKTSQLPIPSSKNNYINLNVCMGMPYHVHVHVCWEAVMAAKEQIGQL